MLVLDSFDDRDLIKKLSPPLWECLPRSSKGSILITTRSKGAATRLVEDHDAIKVDAIEASMDIASQSLPSQACSDSGVFAWPVAHQIRINY